MYVRTASVDKALCIELAELPKDRLPALNYVSLLKLLFKYPVPFFLLIFLPDHTNDALRDFVTPRSFIALQRMYEKCAIYSNLFEFVKLYRIYLFIFCFLAKHRAVLIIIAAIIHHCAEPLTRSL